MALHNEYDASTARLGSRLGCSQAGDAFASVSGGNSYAVQAGGIVAGPGLPPASGDLTLTFRYQPDRDIDGIDDAMDACPSRDGIEQADPFNGCPALRRFEADAQILSARVARDVRVAQLNVRGPGGARVSVRCTRGCQRFIGTIKGKGAARTLRVPSLRNRTLRNGANVRVFITRPGSVGTSIRFTVRNGRIIKGLRQCLSPGSFQPRPCR